MSKNPDNILVSRLTELGFSREEAKMYCYLYKKGSKTALQLSRELKLPRTRIYRILENLTVRQFINEVVDCNSRRFETSSLDQFDNLRVRKLAELTELNHKIPLIKDLFLNIPQQSGPESKVLRFKGLEGVEQITWNSTKTHGTLYIFEQAQQLENWLPHNKAEWMRKEFHQNRVKVKQILTVPEMADYTKITGHIEDTTSRYVKPNILALKSDLIIYDNVVATYSRTGDEIFGVELHDKFISTILKQMFMYFWQKAKPMQKLSLHGALALKDATHSSQAT